MHTYTDDVGAEYMYIHVSSKTYIFIYFLFFLLKGLGGKTSQEQWAYQVPSSININFYWKIRVPWKMIDPTAGTRGSIRRTWANIFVPLHFVPLHVERGLPGGPLIKNLPASAGDVGFIPGLGRSPGEGNGNPLQYSCLANPMDRGAWRATVHKITKESDTTEY